MMNVPQTISSFPLQWMQKFWKSDSKFQTHGVDGSLCSIMIYLSEVLQYFWIYTTIQYNTMIYMKLRNIYIYRSKSYLE